MVSDIGDEVAEHEAMDEALEGFLHEVHHIEVTAVYDGRFKAIDKMGRVCFH